MCFISHRDCNLPKTWDRKIKSRKISDGRVSIKRLGSKNSSMKTLYRWMKPVFLDHLSKETRLFIQIFTGTLLPHFTVPQSINLILICPGHMLHGINNSEGSLTGVAVFRRPKLSDVTDSAGYERDVITRKFESNYLR